MGMHACIPFFGGVASMTDVACCPVMDNSSCAAVLLHCLQQLCLAARCP